MAVRVLQVQEEVGKEAVVPVCTKPGTIEAIVPGTQTVALLSFQNKTPFFICFLLIYGVWKGIVVGEQFCFVVRLWGSLELAPSQRGLI